MPEDHLNSIATDDAAEPFRYDAFITYRHIEPDRKWAKWLHSALETYRVPRQVMRDHRLGRRVGRVFRDEEELPAADNLAREIDEALRQSRFLIVVCSPRLVSSRWCNREIQRFRDLGRHDRILALLIDGEPSDAFPPTLREIRRSLTDAEERAGRQIEEVEPLAADVRPMPGERAGRRRRLAKLRLLAQILGVRFDDLRRREQNRRQVRLSIAGMVAAVLLLCLGGVGRLAVRNHSIQRADDLSRQLTAAADSNDWSAPHLNAMESIADDLDRTIPGRGAEARSALAERFSDYLASSIRRPMLAPGDIAQVESGIALLEKRDPARGAALRKTLADRRSDWELAVELAPPYRNADDVFGPDGYRLQDGGLLTSRVDRIFGFPLAATRVSAAGNVKAELICDYRGYEKQRLGLAFFAGVDHAPLTYQFVLSKSRLEIRRGNATLASADNPLSAETPPPAGPRPMRLTATRTGQRFTMQLNDAPPLVFEDVFAPPTSGAFAIALAGQTISVNRLRVWRQDLPQTPSPLEAGDALYAQGNLPDALAEYRRQATTASGADRRAAEFKAALCLLNLQNTTEAAQRFEELLAGGNDDWAILAGCQLWLLEMRQNRFDDAETLLSLLSARYTFEQLAKLVPEDVRDELNQKYRDSSSGTGVIFIDPKAVSRFQQYIAADELLGLDVQKRAMNRLILAKAYHRLGQLNPAILVARQGLAIPGEAETLKNTQTSLREEYAWLLRSMGQKDEARRELDAHLEGPDSNNALLLERARLDASEERWDEAEKDIEHFFATTGSHTPYHFWSTACLLRGFLRDRRGDTTGAAEAWRSGVVKLDGSGRATRTNPQFSWQTAIDGASDMQALNADILGGLSGEWGDAEGSFYLKRLLDELAGHEVASDGSISSMLQSVHIPPSALTSPWQTPRGREIARHFALRDINPRESIVALDALIVADIMRQSIGGEFTADEEAVFWDAASHLSGQFTAATITRIQLLQLMASWKGMNNVLGWGTVSHSLDPALRGPMAYVLGRRFMTLKRPDAADLFRAAANDAPDGSALQRAAAAALANPVSK